MPWPGRLWTWLFLFLYTVVFCLLHEKHGGFEQEPRSDLASLDHLAYREFVFMDVPDASHGVSSQDGLFSVLKQGNATTLRCGQLVAK